MENDMGWAVLKQTESFTLHIRCENCMRESEKLVAVPVGEDAPRDAEELMGSVYLESIPYRCRPCGSVIGRLIGISGGNRYGT
jgi:ribosomal protein S27E